MRTSLFVAAALLAMSAAHAREPQPISANVSAKGRVVLPMRIQAGFPFVQGVVNGREGYFLLDTGTPYPAFLNNAFVRLPSGRPLSSGAASSGQRIVVFRYGCLDSLEIAAGHTLDSLCDLPGADLGFVATELKLPLLGFLGNGLFKDYRVTFDWIARRVTLDDRAHPVEAGAVTTFRFSPTDRQVPHFTLQAGDISIDGAMDTGDPGHVRLTQADADKLTASNKLVKVQGQDGSAHYVLAAAEHDGHALDTSALPVTIAGDRSDIMLGFRMLAKYRSIWDYRDRVVRLYR